jgi:iron complex outermembrane recepter protein
LDYAANNPTTTTAFGVLPTASLITNGVVLPVGVWRPFKAGGNPLFDNGPSEGERSYDQFRISAGFDGTLADFGLPQLNYDLRVTYGQQSAYRDGYDSLTNRLALALRGFGGPGCDKEAGTPGVQVSPGVTVTSANAAALAGTNGCVFFNPFSNSIQQSYFNGATNPQYEASLSNSRDLTAWFFQKGTTEATARLFVMDALISGDTGLDLWGGDIQFALGAQYRRNYYEVAYSAINDAQVNPCVGTPDFFVVNCSGAARNGPLVFLGVGNDADVENDVYAFFGELQLPVTDSFNIQLAARFEDYGGLTGTTFDPKISARWQATDWLAFRGSAGSTFRGPPLVQLQPGNVTALTFYSGSFRAFDIGGNPALEPESAETLSGGVIVDAGGFKGSIDYYSFKFDNPIIAEPFGGIANTLFPGGSTANCGVAAFAPLQNRFTFSDSTGDGIPDCAPGNTQRVQTFYINGPAVETSGIDILGEYDFGDIFGGDLSIGATFTYVLEYKVDPLQVEGFTVQPGFEAAGFLNYQTTAYPIPELKGNAYVEYEYGDHNLRLTMNYIDEYTDQRTAPYTTTYYSSEGVGQLNPNGKNIDRFVTFDLAYRVFLPYDVTLTAAVDNLTDEDPSFARLDLNYDPFTSDPLGRRFKIGVRKAF